MLFNFKIEFDLFFNHKKAGELLNKYHDSSRNLKDLRL